MTQVVILLGVFLLALMLHYFVVMEGFQGEAKPSSPGQTPFSELIDKLSFFSTAELSSKTASLPVDPASKSTEATTTESTPKEATTKDTTVKAAESSDTKKEAEKDKVAPNDSTPSKKEVAVGPKDTANASIAERTEKPVTPDSVSSKVTSALQQGKEFLQSGCKPKPRPVPPPCPGPAPEPPAPCPTPDCPTPKPVPFPCNSDDYIRKDQIPCWGCTLK